MNKRQYIKSSLLSKEKYKKENNILNTEIIKNIINPKRKVKPIAINNILVNPVDNIVKKNNDNLKLLKPLHYKSKSISKNENNDKALIYKTKIENDLSKKQKKFSKINNQIFNNLKIKNNIMKSIIFPNKNINKLNKKEENKKIISRSHSISLLDQSNKTSTEATNSNSSKRIINEYFCNNLNKNFNYKSNKKKYNINNLKDHLQIETLLSNYQINTKYNTGTQFYQNKITKNKSLILNTFSNSKYNYSSNCSPKKSTCNKIKIPNNISYKNNNYQPKYISNYTTYNENKSKRKVHKNLHLNISNINNSNKIKSKLNKLKNFNLGINKIKKELFCKGLQNINKVKNKENQEKHLRNYSLTLPEYKNTNNNFKDKVNDRKKAITLNNSQNESPSLKKTIQITHSNNNSLNKSKTNSNEIDFSFSDDEVLSSRNKCKELFNNINNNKNDNLADFISFCDEMNRKLFKNKY